MQKVIDCLKPLVDAREHNLENAELFGLPVYKPVTKYFPSLEDREDLTLEEPAIYQIACKYDECRTMIDRLVIEAARIISNKNNPTQFPGIH
jgi:hypothetical protein